MKLQHLRETRDVLDTIPKETSNEDKIKIIMTLISSIQRHKDHTLSKILNYVRNIPQVVRVSLPWNAPLSSLDAQYPKSNWLRIKDVNTREVYLVVRIPSNDKDIKYLEHAADNHSYFATQLLLLKKALLAIEKNVKLSKIDQTGDESAPNNHSGQHVPQSINTGSGTIGNPYFEGTTAQYAGPPSKYAGWGKQLQNYQLLRLILHRNGYKDLDVIYVGQWKPARAKGIRTKIVGIGAGGKLVWYKYESDAAGSGQNYIYVKGMKLKLTEFLNLSPNKQDKLLK